MLKLAMLFAVLAIVAGVFGLSNLATEPGTMSRAIFFSLLGIGVVLAALEFTQRKP